MNNENTIVKPEERILDFNNNKFEIISIEELRLTTDEKYLGNKELNDITHHEFITKILELTLKIGLKAEIEPIYAAQNKAKHSQGVSILPILEEKHGIGNIQAHILRRILTRIIISDFDDDISSTSIAIAYHQDGIEVAIGPNIKICSNQCILGSGSYMKTFGQNKMPDHKRILEVLGDWLHTFEDKRKIDQEILSKMMDYTIDYPKMANIIGELSLKRIAKDNLNLISSYPLSQSQIGKISESYLKDMYDRKKNDQEQIISLYDIYNYGTAQLKPSEMEIPNVLMQNAAFGDYLINLVG